MIKKVLFACASALIATSAMAADPFDPYDDGMTTMAEDQCQRDGICSPPPKPPKPPYEIVVG